MRTLKTILVIASLILLSCERSEFSTDLIGKWYIYGSGGGFSGQGASYNFDYLSLETDYDYGCTRNDTIVESGTYKLFPNSSDIFQGEYTIKFNPKHKIKGGVPQISEKEMIVDQLAADTLSLCDGMIDGFCFYFVKE